MTRTTPIDVIICGDTRTREQIIEEILDAVQDLFDQAEPTDESQMYQEYYYIPSRPLDIICLKLIPELEDLK